MRVSNKPRPNTKRWSLRRVIDGMLAPFERMTLAMGIGRSQR